MSSIQPLTVLADHEVFNQPPPSGDVGLFPGNRALAFDAFYDERLVALIERAMPAS